MTETDDDAVGTRSILREVEVVGTPEEVWEAVATGPGISAWFVPTEVEAGIGGVVRQSFGPGEEMQVEGRVQAWDPPRRFAFGVSADPEQDGLAFEFVVEARDGGSCLVRFVNSGFGVGEDWDAQYDGMAEGWTIFLLNLQLHLELFPGEPVASSIPMVTTSGDRDAIWKRLGETIGVHPGLPVGARVVTDGSAPHLSGVVRATEPQMVSLVLDEPARGTGFVAVELAGDQVITSVWLYLRGDGASALAERERAAWEQWLTSSIGE